MSVQLNDKNQVHDYKPAEFTVLFEPKFPSQVHNFRACQ
jgi:hypothetical protein